VKQFLIAFDQLFNTLIGGFADESLAAHAWRSGKTDKVWNAARIAIDLLFFFDKQHCFQSYISEYERKQLPDEYRK